MNTERMVGFLFRFALVESPREQKVPEGDAFSLRPQRKSVFL